jgi:hypothetical protein
MKPSAAEVLVLEELALRRYGARNSRDELRILGTVVEFRLRQRLFDADGAAKGEGVVSVTGRREFGGRVRFDGRDVVVQGATSDEAAQTLEAMARHLLDALAALCRCGRFREACDCCAACSGVGRVHRDEGSQVCAACGGEGFLAAAVPPRP